MTALSRTERLYARVAPIYDVIYGIGLNPGRRRALQVLAPVAGERILEVGTGTGLSAVGYPRGCQVIAIDLSAQMLARAKARLTTRGVGHVVLCRMHAAALAFPDGVFDAVYAPYLLNVVPDPLRVAREMARVCRPGGRLVLLNHFHLDHEPASLMNRAFGGFAALTGGARWDLDLRSLLVNSGLEAALIETVNLARVSSVVACRRVQVDAAIHQV